MGQWIRFHRWRMAEQHLHAFRHGDRERRPRLGVEHRGQCRMPASNGYRTHQHLQQFPRPTANAYRCGVQRWADRHRHVDPQRGWLDLLVERCECTNGHHGHWVGGGRLFRDHLGWFGMRHHDERHHRRTVGSDRATDHFHQRILRWGWGWDPDRERYRWNSTVHLHMEQWCHRSVANGYRRHVWRSGYGCERLPLLLGQRHHPDYGSSQRRRCRFRSYHLCRQRPHLPE